MTENRELLEVEDGPAFRVGKVSLGVVRDFRIADHFSLGAAACSRSTSCPTGLRRSMAATIRSARWASSG